jgi:hypothetical protein
LRRVFSNGGRRGVVAKAVEEELDFGEGEIHFTGEADEENAAEGVAGVAVLTVDAVGWGEEADLFVVAYGGGVDARAGGEFSDFHGCVLSLYFLPVLLVVARDPSG